MALEIGIRVKLFWNVGDRQSVDISAQYVGHFARLIEFEGGPGHIVKRLYSEQAERELKEQGRIPYSDIIQQALEVERAADPKLPERELRVRAYERAVNVSKTVPHYSVCAYPKFKDESGNEYWGGEYLWKFEAAQRKRKAA